MDSSGNSTRVLAVFLSIAGAACTCSAATISFTGTFNHDDNVQLFAVTLNAPSTLTVKTWSYGGGVNGAGKAIPAGGFATDLAIFSASGALIDFADSGGCPPQNMDPGTGMCGDGVLTEGNLAAGSYTVALSEFFNIPNGLSLSAGFLEDGMGNFTGPTLCGATGAFLDSGCNQRTGNYALDISGVSSAAALPEPSFALITGLVLVGAAVMRRRKRT